MLKFIYIKTCILAVFCYIGIVFNIFIYCIQCVKPSLMNEFNINFILINFARYSEHFKFKFELKPFLSKFLFEYVNFNLHREYNSSCSSKFALNDPNLSLYFTIMIIIIFILIVLIIKFKLKIKLCNITKLLSVSSVIFIEENNILPESTNEVNSNSAEGSVAVDSNSKWSSEELNKTKIENKEILETISNAPNNKENAPLINISTDDSENSNSDTESLNSIDENQGWENSQIPFVNLTDQDKETYIQNKMELKGLNTNSFLSNYFIQAILNNTSGSKIDVDKFLNQNLNTILNDQRNIQLNQNSFVRIRPLLLNNSESLNLQNLQTKSFQSVVPFKPMNDFDLDE